MSTLAIENADATSVTGGNDKMKSLERLIVIGEFLSTGSEMKTINNRYQTHSTSTLSI